MFIMYFRGKKLVFVIFFFEKEQLQKWIKKNISYDFIRLSSFKKEDESNMFNLVYF